MPALRKLILAGAALSTLLISGCTMAALESTALTPTAGFAPSASSPAGVLETAAADAEPGAGDELASDGESMVASLGEDGTLLAPSGYAKAERITGSARPQIDALIAKYAAVYEVPVELVHAVVKRESTYNPNAYSKGHWGLMQIKHATARGMGYKGSARGLLDPETNLKYAVKYLRGAYMVADGNQRLADRMYQRGYYYDAKRKGLLDETGLGRDRVRKRRSA